MPSSTKDSEKMATKQVVFPLSVGAVQLNPMHGVTIGYPGSPDVPVPFVETPIIYDPGRYVVVSKNVDPKKWNIDFFVQGNKPSSLPASTISLLVIGTVQA